MAETKVTDHPFTWTSTGGEPAGQGCAFFYDDEPVTCDRPYYEHEAQKGEPTDG